MKLSANNLERWTGGRQFSLPSPLTPASYPLTSASLCPYSRFPPLTFVVLSLPSSPYSRFIPGPRIPNSRFPLP